MPNVPVYQQQRGLQGQGPQNLVVQQPTMNVAAAGQQGQMLQQLGNIGMQAVDRMSRRQDSLEISEARHSFDADVRAEYDRVLSEGDLSKKGAPEAFGASIRATRDRYLGQFQGSLDAKALLASKFDEIEAKYIQSAATQATEISFAKMQGNLRTATADIKNSFMSGAISLPDAFNAVNNLLDDPEFAGSMTITQEVQTLDALRADLIQEKANHHLISGTEADFDQLDDLLNDPSVLSSIHPKDLGQIRQKVHTHRVQRAQILEGKRADRAARLRAFGPEGPKTSADWFYVETSEWPQVGAKGTPEQQNFQFMMDLMREEGVSNPLVQQWAKMIGAEMSFFGTAEGVGMQGDIARVSGGVPISEIPDLDAKIKQDPEYILKVQQFAGYKDAAAALRTAEEDSLTITNLVDEALILATGGDPNDLYNREAILAEAMRAASEGGEKFFVGGAPGALASLVNSSSRQARLDVITDELRSKVEFAALSELKARGIKVGALTESEREALGKATANFDWSAPDQTLKNLVRYRDLVSGIIQKRYDSYNEDFRFAVGENRLNPTMISKASYFQQAAPGSMTDAQSGSVLQMAGAGGDIVGDLGEIGTLPQPVQLNQEQGAPVGPDATGGLALEDYIDLAAPTEDRGQIVDRGTGMLTMPGAGDQ